MLFLLCLLPAHWLLSAQKDSLSWSVRMAQSVMKRHPQAVQIDRADQPKWDYKPSFVLTAFEDLHAKTQDPVLSAYVKAYADAFIDAHGNIAHYDREAYNLDAFNPGKLLFGLSQTSKDGRYRKAMQNLMRQLETQPRNPDGGFWHKQIYPDQMWTDGLYMALPFYTRYTLQFEKGKGLDDIARQFELIHDHALDAATRLPFHAWDQSKRIAWADPQSGVSPTIWARGVAFYAMALADVLDYFPPTHPKYKQLVSYLAAACDAIAQKQDASGLWFQVADKNASLERNYLESSASLMFAYVFAKSVQNGYLSERFLKAADKAFDGVLRQCVTVDKNGELHLGQISQGIGLGGNPFRDGSNAYYAKAKINTDNSMGVGAFILAAVALNR